MKTKQDHYDIIGDIHGHAAELHALLAKLGYEERNGAHRHPEGRKVIFLGDWIDRGPAIRETLRVVRAMHDAGTALAVPGNHEFNALAYATQDGRGNWLRKHTPRNQEQHGATLAEFAGNEDEWADHLRWFQSLPITIELPGLRAAHAVWDTGALATLGAHTTLDDDLIRVAGTHGTPEFAAVETLLKGIELPLPEGITFADRYGTMRYRVRAKWWMNGAGRTCAELALQPEVRVPEVALSGESAGTLAGYGVNERPVFNGHYWLEGEPALMAPNVAILDYSVAKGGALTAYRWDGEQRLDAAKFVQVQAGEAKGENPPTKEGGVGEGSL